MPTNVLTRTLHRDKPANKPLGRLNKLPQLHYSQYVEQGYKPLPVVFCIEELRTRGVQFGRNENDEFWFDAERLCVTPGLRASLSFHFPEIVPADKSEEEDWI